VKRRELLAGLLCFGTLSNIWAQALRKVRVAMLYAGEAANDAPGSEPFFAEMRRLGWIEGRTVEYDKLFAEGSRARGEEQAKSAAARKPDLIFAAVANSAQMAMRASATIPVVFVSGSDPVTAGLVDSLPRPGRNATGAFQIAGDIVSKRYELLHEALPRLKLLGVLLDKLATDYRNQKRVHSESVRPKGLSLSLVEIESFDEQIPAALAAMKEKGIGVFAVTPSTVMLARRRELLDLARRQGLAVIGHRIEWAEAGALFSYGADIGEAYQRAAGIADRVLRGARPAETPVEQASKFQLVVNLKSAKALGITLPKNLLLRADRVIE
jgi:putative ABC transport system substrate-binding protein